MYLQYFFHFLKAKDKYLPEITTTTISNGKPKKLISQSRKIVQTQIKFHHQF